MNSIKFHCSRCKFFIICVSTLLATLHIYNGASGQNQNPKIDACLQLCPEYIPHRVVAVLPKTRPSKKKAVVRGGIQGRAIGGGGSLQGRADFYTPNGGKYTYPDNTLFIRIYEGPIRSEQERTQGVQLLTPVWDGIGLPRSHNISGYTGVDGYEEIDEFGNYRKVEEEHNYEYAYETGPYIQPVVIGDKVYG